MYSIPCIPDYIAIYHILYTIYYRLYCLCGLWGPFEGGTELVSAAPPVMTPTATPPPMAGSSLATPGGPCGRWVAAGASNWEALCRDPTCIYLYMCVYLYTHRHLCILTYTYVHVKYTYACMFYFFMSLVHKHAEEMYVYTHNTEIYICIHLYIYIHAPLYL